ncbi:MAG: hypothetical protein PHR07_01840, partial [Acidaminococcaceae bacterium]|nr:hypothetical protein [Acidaminococcaceae bacterium]
FFSYFFLLYGKSLEIYKNVLANKKDTQELRAFLTTFVQSIIVSETKVEIHMNFNSVVGFVVPKAGLEPARL